MIKISGLWREGNERWDGRANPKAAERTAALHDADARFTMPLHIGEAFGLRLSFLAPSHAVTMSLCAVESVHGVKTKAAERTAALHDAGARFAMPLHIGEAFGLRLSFLVFSGAFDSVQVLTDRAMIGCG